MSQLGVLKLAREMIAFRERVDADQLQAIYLIDGDPVTMTVTAQAVVVETGNGVAGAIEVEAVR